MAAPAVSLNVTGMTCAGCQATVQRALAAVPGVSGASVNLLLHTATARFEGPVETLVRAVESSGYGATVAAVQKSAVEQQEDLARERAGEFERLKRSAVVALAIGTAMMGAMAVLPMDHRLHWVWLVLTAYVVAVPGRGFYARAYSALRHGGSNMDVLIALGTGTAFVYSVAMTVLDRHDVYFEASVWIIALVLTGRALEARATRETSSALQKLARLQPAEAVVVRMLVEKKIPLEDVRVGDLVSVYRWMAWWFPARARWMRRC
jgi:P-type Cu+ transporter